MTQALGTDMQELSWRERVGKAALELALAGACFLVAAVMAATGVDLLDLGGAWGILAAPLATGVAALAYQALAPVLAGGSADLAAPTRRSASPGLLTLRAPQPGTSAAITVLVAALAALVGSIAVGWLVQWVSGAPVQEQARIMELFARGDPRELTLLGVGVIVLAPVAEEWLFRGLLFRRLTQWVPSWVALALSALLFASVHANLSGLWTYLWLASCFTFALQRSGRLSCAILVHAANNAATFVLLFAGWTT